MPTQLTHKQKTLIGEIASELIAIPGVAAVVLGVWIALRPRLHLSRRWIGLALLNGCLIGLHWHLFFLAARLGNVSVAMTGIATCALWVAFLEPLLIKDRRVHGREVVLALAVTGGVALVALHSSVPFICLLTGILSAGVAALFSIFNARLVKHLPPVPLTALAMSSACAFCALLSLFTMRPFTAAAWMPAPADWLPLLILATLCTVIAFSTCVWLQKRVSPFSIGIAGNMEPVYAMIMASVIWPGSEIMSWQFYTGAAIIIGCVVAHASRNDEARMAKSEGAGK